MMDIDLRNLKKHGSEGYVFTAIKAEDTEHNEQIHKAFRSLADIEFKGDRTIALHSLLRNYEDRGLFEATWDNIKVLESRIDDLEEQAKKPEPSDDKGTF